MELNDYQNVIKLNKLAKSWIEEYTRNNLGVHSAKLKEQYREMRKLKAKTDLLIEKQGGVSSESSDWKGLKDEIIELAKKDKHFASCFGEPTPQNNEDPITQATASIAMQVKRMTAAWVGQFAENVPDKSAIDLVTVLHEQAKKLLKAPKDTKEEQLTIVAYGSQNRTCRKMKRSLDFIIEEYDGMVQVEYHEIKDEDGQMEKLGLENLPTLIFNRGGKKIAKHEGELSISALQQKLNIMLDGANITDSSSVPSVKDMKEINNMKELYQLGEFLLFYFEASWCGICKKTTPVVNQYARTHSNVKFESIQVDGSHMLHKSFDVTQVPSLVFVRDGVVIGKHVGYINPSAMKKLMDQFADSKKRKMPFTNTGEASVIKGEEENLAKEQEEQEEQ